MECEFPVINIKNDQFKEIFENTTTIAIPGLSPNEEKDSHRVAKYLQKQGYKIIPIYPKGDTILDEKVYRSIEEIPFKIDMIDMFRKPEVADILVDAIASRDDIKVLWLQKGIINNAAAKKALDLGVKVVQDRCTMIEHRRIYAK